MPTYIYQCETCDESFERLSSIATRREPCEAPCPACGAQTIVLAPAAPLIGDHYRLRKAQYMPADWTSKKNAIKKAHRNNTMP